MDGLFDDGHYVKHVAGCQGHKRQDGPAQVNGRRIKSEQWLLQLEGQRLVLVEPLCHADQDLAEILRNAPVATFIGVGKS